MAGEEKKQQAESSFDAADVPFFRFAKTSKNPKKPNPGPELQDVQQGGGAEDRGQVE